MVTARMRVRESHPLQKPWVSSRSKMARSGQGRQRLKTFLPLDKTRKEPLLPSAKIRSRWRSHQIFGATALRSLIVGTIRSHSIAANMKLARLQSELVRGFGIPTSSSLPSLVPSRRLCFFFSSIIGATQVPPLLLLFHHWYHPNVLNSCQSKIEGFIVPMYPSFSFCFCSQLLVQACLSLLLYAILVLCIIKDDFIPFCVFFLFCNNYFVNGCAGAPFLSNSTQDRNPC